MCNIYNIYPLLPLPTPPPSPQKIFIKKSSILPTLYFFPNLAGNTVKWLITFEDFDWMISNSGR